MQRRLFFIVAPFILLLIFFCCLSFGAGIISPARLFAALTQPDVQSYEQAVVLYQRLPRALIALYVGAVMACSGLVFQELVRNPLASSSALGINAGATLFVVTGAICFDLGIASQGIAALAGALFGFFSCLFVTRLAGINGLPNGLFLILAGTLVSMLYLGLGNAVLLSSPSQRTEFLSWITGNINHVYINRLYSFWWIGIIALTFLFCLSRPLTLSLLGREKALSTGVNAQFVFPAALMAAVLASGSAVAICGPIGFIGLIVPHMTRPLVGNNFVFALPACALTGAAVCLIADLGARFILYPFVVHTGLLMDLLGGLVFIWVIKKYYLSPLSVKSS